MKQIEAVAALSHYHKISETNNYSSFPVRIRIYKWLAERNEEYIAAIRQAAEECGASIEPDGRVVFHGTDSEQQTNTAKFADIRPQIDNAEVAVDLPPKAKITNAELGGRKLDDAAVIALMPFFDFEFMEEQNDISQNDTRFPKAF